MKHILWLACCLGLFGMAKTPLPLVNGDFEKGLRGWTVVDHGITQLERGAACGGNYGIRITDTSPERGAELFSERLKAKENTIYGISCMGRASDTKANVTVYLMCYDANGRCLTAYQKTGELIYFFQNTGEWKRHLFLAQTPRGTARVSVRFHSGLRGTGGMEFDDVAIHEYTEKEATETGHPVSTLINKNVENKMLNVEPEKILKAMARVENAEHPRLFASAAHFAALKQTVETGKGIHARFYARLAFLADTLLTVKPLEREVLGRRILHQSRIEVYRMSTLALCYRLGGKAAWRDRCIEEMRAIARFKDWNPSHFLDVGEMTLALATAYDWLYDDLTPEDRTLIERAIIDKGLNSADPMAWWRQAGNNWGQVCNTGMIAGALAVAGVDPESSRRQLVESIRNLAIPMRAYAPNGNYPEGPAYWEYGTGFTAMALAMLEQALGTDFGLSDLSGFKETGAYFDYLTGPSGEVFSYADCSGLGCASMGCIWWFARRFNQPGLLERNERTWFEKACADRKPVNAAGNNGWIQAYTMFWLMEPAEHATAFSELPLLWNAGGAVPIVIMRNTWEHDKMVFLGLKGGTARSNHAHMDGGSFIMEARGIRWFEDLKPERYERIEEMGIDLWNMQQHSGRWNLFRLNNFGHNTLTIDNQLQQVSGSVAVLKAEQTDDGACITVLDMTSVYSNVCTKAVRTAVLSADGTVELLDELEGLRPGVSVVWGGLTSSKAVLRDGQGVRLSKDGSVYLDVTSSGAGEWALVDVTHPQPAFKGNSENPGFTRVTLSAVAPADGRLVFHVTMKTGEAE